jgi:ABC-type multidrug transport system ATPase subunit
VRECFQFAADLKMKASQEEKNRRVDSIVRMMRLERSQNTLIGGEFMKGGERKRVSVGFEIMCEPQVILLDEPTSGLDSFTAFLLILSLNRYSRRGKTVILTIHQPSADIWNLCHKIMLLVDGHFIYQGKGQTDVINYFADIGFKCPSNSNPADYMLSIMHNESEVNKKNYELYFKTYEK